MFIQSVYPNKQFFILSLKTLKNQYIITDSLSDRSVLYRLYKPVKEHPWDCIPHVLPYSEHERIS
jgi:hypothetical protein